MQSNHNTNALSRRGLTRMAAIALLGMTMLAAAPAATAQTPVPTQPIDPGYSTQGVFFDDNGVPIVAVVNLTFTKWNGVDVIFGNSYHFESGQSGFMIVLYAAPATVVYFDNIVGGVLSNLDGGAEPRWSDSYGRSGVYVPF